jgi:hypothetical protein
MLELAARSIGGLCSRAQLPRWQKPGRADTRQRPRRAGPLHRRSWRRPGTAVRGIHAPGAAGRRTARDRGPCRCRGGDRDNGRDHHHPGRPPCAPAPRRGPVPGLHLRAGAPHPKTSRRPWSPPANPCAPSSSKTRRRPAWDYCCRTPKDVMRGRTGTGSSAPAAFRKRNMRIIESENDHEIIGLICGMYRTSMLLWRHQPGTRPAGR